MPGEELKRITIETRRPSSAYPGGAQTAPVGVQRAAFAKLYAEAGTSPWAPYDGC